MRAGYSRLVLAMALTLLGLAALANWDQGRESDAALEELAEEQRVLAGVVAAAIQTRLHDLDVEARLILEEGGQHVRPVDGVRLMEPASGEPVERTAARFEWDVRDHNRTIRVRCGLVDLMPGGALFVGDPTVALVYAPGLGMAITTDGRPLDVEEVRAGLLDGNARQRVSREASARLGLPERLGVAGFHSFIHPGTGEWHVGVVSSAARARDRSARSRWRLAVTFLLGTLVVLGFGGVALRSLRHEWQLEARLDSAERARLHEDVLARESRSATMLTLAAGVAHEVGTPLAVIQGRLEQMGSAGRFDARLVGIALEQVERVHRIVQGFLHLARGNAVAFTSILPSDISVRAVELVEHRFAKAGVLLQARVDTQVRTNGHVLLLEHALVNLLLNACDASPRGTRVQLTVSLGDRRVVWEVLDEGHGLPEVVARAQHQPFFSTKPVGQGSGVGLALAQEIARLHGGQVELVARPEGGTRAQLWIPLEASPP